MIKMMNSFLLSFFLSIPSANAKFELKLGLIFPNCTGSDPKLENEMGFCTSASAALIALERVKREQLLPGARVKLVWRYDQCDEAMATGMTVDLLKNERVDVLFGPPCTLPSDISIVFAAMYNRPIFIWAAPNAMEKKIGLFHTRVRMAGSAEQLGDSIKDMLSYFQWTRIAIFYSHIGADSRCQSIIQGSLKQFRSSEIQVVLLHEVAEEAPTDTAMTNFLNEFPSQTRIVLLCNDDSEYDRRLLSLAQERGLTEIEYVYIVANYMQSGDTARRWVDANNNEKWRRSLRTLLILEMAADTNGDQLRMFHADVGRRMQEAPFGYKSPRGIEPQGSVYSPFLYDAVYAYALALNRTLGSGGSKSDGIAVAKSAARQQFQEVDGRGDWRGFQVFDTLASSRRGNVDTLCCTTVPLPGMSGFVSIDDQLVRRQSYSVKILDGNNPLTVLLLVTHKEPRVNLLVSKEKLWASRSGYKPMWHPKCGFKNDLCYEGKDHAISLVVVCVALACCFSLCVFIRCASLMRKRGKLKNVELMKWKIYPSELEKIVEAGYGSKVTVNTEESADVGDLVAKNDDRIVILRGRLCYIKRHKVNVIVLSKEQHLQLKMLMDINCENLNRFMGLCIEEGTVVSVWKYCGKGSLHEVLQNDVVKLDWYFKYSFIKDLVHGMEYLHNETHIHSHGYLKPTNCLISDRWILKITNYGLPNLRTYNDLATVDSRFYTAPELLRNEFPPPVGTPSGDVYSFAMILYEIITRESAFASYGKAPEEILYLLRTATQPPFRPEFPYERDPEMDQRILTLITDCWSEDPNLRPNFNAIRVALKQMKIGREMSLLDHAIKTSEKYANSLESLIKERTQQLEDEAKKADIILYKLLPKPVANRLKQGRDVEPESYDNVTVIYSDIAEFESITNRSTPFQLISLLNDVYYELDEIIEDYDAFKIQTVNDIYMLASGLRLDKEFIPVPIGVRQAQEIDESKAAINHAIIGANLALHFQLSMSNYRIPHLPQQPFQLRISMHTGSVAAGVVGKATPRYCLFGDTVNLGNKLLEYSKPGCIHMSESTYTSLIGPSGGGFVTKPRGEIHVKDVGPLVTYWLLGKKAQYIDDATGLAPSNDGSLNRSETGSIERAAKVRAW